MSVRSILCAALAVASSSLSTPSPGTAGQEATVNSWLPEEKHSKGAEAKPGAWVKLCEPATPALQVPICRLLHERLDGKSAQLVVSAEFWDVVGKQDEKTLVVRIPPGFIAEAGVRIGFYKSEDWNLMRDGQKIDQGKLKVLAVKPIVCDAEQCKGQIRLGPAIWNDIRPLAGFMVLAMQKDRKPMGFPVSLAGFNEAQAAAPYEGYEAAREKLIAKIKRGAIP